MAEHQAGLELLEWLKVLGGAAATAAGTVWSFLKGVRQELMQSIAAIQQRVDAVEQTLAKHETSLAVLRTNADNHVERLDEIKEFVKDVSDNVKTLSAQLTEFLMEIKKH